jgi:hypothetical protein
MAHQRPQPDSFTSVSGWRCPLCDTTAYNRVRVRRPDGKEYLTEFYECAGCTVMFRNPGRFTRLGTPIRRWASDVEPRSLGDVHGFIREKDL